MPRPKSFAFPVGGEVFLLTSPFIERFGDFHDRSLSRGQKLSWRAVEERGCNFFSIPSPRLLASQPRFLLVRRTRLPFAGATFLAAQKIELVISCQSRN